MWRWHEPHWRVGAPVRGCRSSVDRVPLTAVDIVAATGGRLTHGRADRPVDGISIDSRTVAAGDLFVAIRGERFDGHRFVAEALSRGVRGAMVEAAAALETAAPAPDAVLIVVDDTTRALQLVARDVRRRSGSRVVAITGSAGK